MVIKHSDQDRMDDERAKKEAGELCSTLLVKLRE